MSKIPGTESSPISTPEDFERYARSIAEYHHISADLAQQLLINAARIVCWPKQ